MVLKRLNRGSNHLGEVNVNPIYVPYADFLFRSLGYWHYLLFNGLFADLAIQTCPQHIRVSLT